MSAKYRFCLIIPLLFLIISCKPPVGGVDNPPNPIIDANNPPNSVNSITPNNFNYTLVVDQTATFLFAGVDDPDGDSVTIVITPNPPITGIVSGTFSYSVVGTVLTIHSPCPDSSSPYIITLTVRAFDGTDYSAPTEIVLNFDST